MRIRQALGAVAAVALLTSGCLLKDTEETWYLSQDGAVTWVVTETDVRSDAQAAADRENEETAYRLAVDRQDHPMARAFRALGLTDLQTVVLRRDVPLTVRTEARGLTIGELGLRLIQRSGLTGTSVLAREGDAWVWTLAARDPRAPDATASLDEDEDLEALLSDLDHLKVVLTNGRFQAAEGFTLSGDKRVATLVDPESPAQQPGADDTTLTLKLRWVR